MTPRGLLIFNACVALLQILTGAAIFGITDKNAKLPWYTDFIASAKRSDGPAFYVPVAKLVASLPIGYYAGVFLLLSAIDHILVCLPGLNGIYNRYLCINQNFFRWLEYSLSAAVMHVMIAQLAGVTEIHLLFTIFGLSSATMAYGLLMEQQNGRRIPTYTLGDSLGDEPTCDNDRPSQFIYGSPTPGAPANAAVTSAEGQPVDWTPFVLGFVPHFFCWAVIFCFFFQGVKQGSPPAFVWAIIFVVFFIDLLFALNQLLQFLQVKGWRGYAGGEFWYIVLSVTAKQLLAWINYGGTRRFSGGP